MARADSRAVHPCPLTRRFGEPAGAVENHCPVGCAGRSYRAGGKQQSCWCWTSLPAYCSALVTLSHYSLPARFISDCICFSRLCPSIIRFPLTPCLHARRSAEIRIDKSSQLVRSDHGTSCCRRLCPPYALPNPLSHHSRAPSSPQLLKAVHCKRRTRDCARCVCFAVNDPSTPLCLRHHLHYVSHRHRRQKK